MNEFERVATVVTEAHYTGRKDIKYTRKQALAEIKRFPWAYLALSGLGAKYAGKKEFWGRPALAGEATDDQTTTYALFVLEAES